MRLSWYAHQLVYQALFDSSVQDEIDWLRGDVIGVILGQTLLVACEKCGYGEYPGHEEASNRYRFGEGTVRFAACGRSRLTTRSILETAATANELQGYLAWLRLPLGSGVDLRHQIERAVHCLLDPDGQYGVAARVLIEFLDAEPLNLGVILPTLRAVCDLALNPPVPPLVMVSDPLCWDEVYPPLRFAKIAEHVADVGLLPLSADHATLAEYQSKLAETSGLADPNQYVHPYSGTEGKTDFDSLIGSDDLEAPLCRRAVDYFEYLSWIQCENWGLRKHSLPIIVNLAECHSGEQSRRNAQVLLTRNKTLFPPLSWVEDGDIGGSSVGSGSFRGWLVLSTAFHFLLSDLMAGWGAFDLTRYPPRLRENTLFMEQLSDTFARTFGTAVL